MKKNILITTNAQKVLDLFLAYPYTEYIEGEIRRLTKISRSGTNYALRDLADEGYITRIIKGKTYFYTAKRKHPVIKQLKVVRTIRFLMPLINNLKKICTTIMLYGSSARGEDHEHSDIDLFVISQTKEGVTRHINKFKSKRKIQCTIKSTVDYESLKKQIRISIMKSTAGYYYGRKLMNKEFENCLKRRKITEFTRGKTLVKKEIEIAAQDLTEAQASYQGKRYKWATIQAYYSMFHASRALLYLKGYRERSHYCLNIAMRVLYVETKKIPVTLIEAFAKAKRLREDADYYDQWNNSTASELVKAASQYLDKARAIITEEKK